MMSRGDCGGLRELPKPEQKIVINGAEVAAYVFRSESFRIEVGRDSAGLSAVEGICLGKFLIEAGEAILTDRS